MIALPPTDEVAAFTYMNALRADAAEAGYYRRQVDRFQHKVDFLEIGPLVFFGLLAVSVAALLLSSDRNSRTVRRQSRIPRIPETETDIPMRQGREE